MPEIEIIPLRLALLELPPQHPESPGPCEVFGFVVRDGVSTVLIDTGVGEGSAVIEALYKPRRAELFETLASHGILPGSVSAIVNSHLHFDHCGNNPLFPGVPIFVQRAEYEAARAAHYTVPAWLHFEHSDYQVVQGPLRLSPDIELFPTPGHTPGHQSVVISTSDGPQLIVAQAAYTASEFESYRVRAAAGRRDAWCPESYAASLGALHALDPVRAFFSHDPSPWVRET